MLRTKRSVSIRPARREKHHEKEHPRHPDRPAGPRGLGQRPRRGTRVSLPDDRIRHPLRRRRQRGHHGARVRRAPQREAGRQRERRQQARRGRRDRPHLRGRPGGGRLHDLPRDPLHADRGSQGPLRFPREVPRVAFRQPRAPNAPAAQVRANFLGVRHRFQEAPLPLPSPVLRRGPPNRSRFSRGAAPPRGHQDRAYRRQVRRISLRTGSASLRSLRAKCGV